MKLAWYGCTSLVWAFALSVVTTLEAQVVRFSLGGGLSIPTGSFGSQDNSGWHVLGGAVAGVGYYDVTSRAQALPSTSRSAVAWSGGGGVAVLGLGPAIGFVEGRYMTIRTSGTPTNLFPVTLGLVFGTR